MSLLFDTAFLAHQEGDIDKAITLYLEALESTPSDANIWNCLGAAYGDKKRFLDAKNALKQALSLNSANAQYYNNLGNALKGLGEWQDAKEQYEKAISIQTNYAQAYNNVGTIHYLQNDWAQALIAFRNAVHAKPDYLEAHRNLALTLLQTNHLDAASKQFQNVITLNPNDWQAHFQLGTLHLNNAELTEAARHYESALAMNPDHIESLNNLGAIYVKTQEMQKALHCFTQILLIDESNLEAKHNCAALFMQHEHYENALRHYLDLHAATPDDIEVNYNMGVAYMALEQLEKAITHFLFVVYKNPNHVDAHTNLGATFMLKADEAKALYYLDRAYQLAPNESVLHMQNALRNKQDATRAPDDYVKKIFDRYASHYNHHLQSVLHYSVPKQLRALFDTFHAKTNLRILDLGCGTGLCGAAFADTKAYLVGVDLSEGMIKQAQSLGIYDQLILQDVHTPIDELFDLVLAGEVLEYLGDLKPFIAQAKHALTQSGWLLLSIEISSIYPFQLQKSARFAHHPDYVTACLQEAGFKVSEQQIVTGRIQDGRDLKLALFLAQVELRN